MTSGEKSNLYKHGMYNTNIYRVWIRMKQRCYNKKYPAYHWYGARGIEVSKEWHDFSIFYKDIGDKPSPKHTLERIDNNGNYCKENCKWATMKEQSSNRRSNVFIEFNGERKTVSQWAESIGIVHWSMQKRLRKWPLSRALTERKYANKI